MKNLEKEFEKMLKNSWVTINKFHYFNDIIIAECYSYEQKQKKYFSWIINESIPIDHIFTKLDEAIIGALAHKYDGVDSNAGNFFCKMIGLDKK